MLPAHRFDDLKEIQHTHYSPFYHLHALIPDSPMQGKSRVIAHELHGRGSFICAVQPEQQ